MHAALRELFEEQVLFRAKDGSDLGESIYIGEAEFLALEVLRVDETAYEAEFARWLSEDWFPVQRDIRNEILELHRNAGRYDDLCDLAKNYQIAPFVGSGMSVPTGLPHWAGLLRTIRDATRVEESELEDLLTKLRFEDAADLLANGTNKHLLDEGVEHSLRVTPRHRITGAIRLLPALLPNLVVTTNLDRVIETVFERCKHEFDHVLAGTALGTYRAKKSASQRFLLKLHGDVQDAATRILLKSEYDEAYGPGKPIRTELHHIYSDKHLLFLGCSLGSDRTVELLREIATLDPNMPKHYAFLPLPANNADRMAREEALTTCRIYPIWYAKDHDMSITALLAGLFDPSS